MGTLRAGVCQPQPSDLQACPHFALLTATYNGVPIGFALVGRTSRSAADLRSASFRPPMRMENQLSPGFSGECPCACGAPMVMKNPPSTELPWSCGPPMKLKEKGGTLRASRRAAAERIQQAYGWRGQPQLRYRFSSPPDPVFQGSCEHHSFVKSPQKTIAETPAGRPFSSLVAADRRAILGQSFVKSNFKPSRINKINFLTPPKNPW
jgi:hypothetical protein